MSLQSMQRLILSLGSSPYQPLFDDLENWYLTDVKDFFGGLGLPLLQERFLSAWLSR